MFYDFQVKMTNSFPVSFMHTYENSWQKNNGTDKHESDF